MTPGGPVVGSETAEWLSRYGPWGVVVIFLGAIIALWSRLNKERDARVEQLAQLGKDHKAEMAALLDRLVAASNTQVDKFADLAEQNSRVIEALTRRVKPAREGS
jgi:hypothetical protein